VRLAIVHTLGGGIISAVDERLAWLNSRGGDVRATLVAPEKRRRSSPSGFFFPVRGELPSAYHCDYEQAVVEDVVPALFRAHAEHGFDIIDAHDGSALIAASKVAKELGVPLVHTIHSHELIERFDEGASDELNNAVNSCDAFLAVSRYIAQAHRGILSGAIQVSRNPVPAGIAPRVRGHLGQEVRAIYVGRVEEAKGFDVLLEAGEHLGPQSGLTITVVGALEDEALAERARRNPLAIDLVGKLERPLEVYELLGNHNVFLFPTRKEACSMALLEAMGTGLAVIASDIGPNLEVAGQAALFHRSGDAADLAQCIQSVLQDRSRTQTMSARSLEQACAFAPDIVFENLRSCYADLCR